MNYSIPVLICSILFNFTKFFEASVTFKKDQELNNLVPVISVSHLRLMYGYSLYLNWSRLVVLGIIPLLVLIYFNHKIFKIVRSRRRYMYSSTLTRKQQNKRFSKLEATVRIILNTKNVRTFIAASGNVKFLSRRKRFYLNYTENWEIFQNSIQI